MSINLTVLYESIWNYFLHYMDKSREDKKHETKKGWHEDHSKVESLDYPFREKPINSFTIPRIKTSFSIMIRN